MNSLLTPRYSHFTRLYKHMKCRENIFKENVDIRSVFDRQALPRYRNWYKKAKNNKNKIGLFFVCLTIVQMDFAYQKFMAILPFKQYLFKHFKALCLGDHTVYSLGVREQFFKNRLPEEVQIRFIQLDDELPLGFTRKLLLRTLKEMQIRLSKEERNYFYNQSGMSGTRRKASSINLRELSNVLDLQDYGPFLEALGNVTPQEKSWQQNIQQKLELEEQKMHEIEGFHLSALELMKKVRSDEMNAVQKLKLIKAYLSENERSELVNELIDEVNQDLTLRFEQFDHFTRVLSI